MNPELEAAWHQGKLDVVCAVCGRAEAANTHCSGCGHEHADAEYRLHRPGSDPRHREGTAALSCVLKGAPAPGSRNDGWGVPVVAEALSARQIAARASASARKAKNAVSQAGANGTAVVASVLTLGLT